MSKGIGRAALGAMIVAVSATALTATLAHAYTQDQQALCTNDAFRLCSSAIPDVDRVTACMVQNRALLSPGCAQFFRSPAAQSVPVSTRKPVAKTRKNKKSTRTN